VSGEDGPVLSAKELCWSVEERDIVGPLDLDIVPGECLAVVGPNGAGKTSLLRLLAGLLAPSSGNVWLEGVPISRMARRALARRIAYVPQLRPLSAPLTVEEVVASGRYPHLAPMQWALRASDFAAVEEALSRTGLESLRDRPLDRLSGGERQSVYIAAALAQGGELLLLDEPTTHLDPRHQRDIARLLAELQSVPGRRQTVVFATHDLDFAAHLATRVLALRGGRAVACGEPGRVLRPAELRELFDAPFVSSDGEHAVARLDFGAP
jgi:iron complex transport system ATP-binding protein